MTAQAEVVREYGPFPDVPAVHGVTFDGEAVWFGAGDRVQSLSPETGRTGRAIPVAADAGTAFDGQHLFQLGAGIIRKIDRTTGAVLATLPSPAGEASAGLTWAEGTLWVSDYDARKIHRIDPRTGAVLRTLVSDRFVTGVTFVEGELWHATWENDASELRRVATDSGEVLEALELPAGVLVSGVESNGGDLFFCGSGRGGKVRAVRRPARAPR
ncbi:MAG: glutamine cyclotransferase [Labilithrix sp.]|nr:glutamine cyclotransferase [Labilithrix sp.]